MNLERAFTVVGAIVTIVAISVVYGLIAVGALWAYSQAYAENSVAALVWAFVAVIAILLFYMMKFAASVKKP